MKMNIAWHTTHPMPRRATMAQRIVWHREHAEHCACRPIPPLVLAAMRERGKRTKKRREPAQVAAHA